MTKTTKAKRSSGKDIVNAVMNEHIHLPGCPDLIVTRGWAYQWFVKLGYDRSRCPTPAAPFSNLDYLVFGRKETSEPLTDLEAYAGFLAGVEACIRRDMGTEAA